MPICCARITKKASLERLPSHPYRRIEELLPLRWKKAGA